MKYLFLTLTIFLVAVVFADTITMKSGLTIQGDVIAIDSDTVTIQTKTGEIKIPTADISEINIEEEEIKKVPEIKEERVLSDQAIPKSIRQVGCGCLGGLVGGSAAGILAVATDGFDGSENLTTTVVLGSIIIGVIIGFFAGGGD